MTNGTTQQERPVPSAGTLLKATAIAAAVAGIILVTLVLPAEYGLDPLGTGRATGLINMATAPPVVIAAANGPIANQPHGYKVDAIELTLMPMESVEYKYHLNKGATMIYSWTASAPVEFDMHTVPQDRPSGSDSFEAGEARSKSGTYTSPYAGIHGWYWRNRTQDTVTIKLTTAGFYDKATMFDESGSGMDIEPKDPPQPESF
jgi:hypothetical protein